MNQNALPNAGHTRACRYTSTRMRIEGSMCDPGWKIADPIPFYIPGTLQEPISKTEASMLWDEQYLYVGFKAYDKDIWSYLTDRDATTCHEDCLEVFFKTHPDREPYYNFEINALGTVYDAFNLIRGAGGPTHHRWAQWDVENLKLATCIQGEINNPDVVDEYWVLELAIPFVELPTLNGKPPSPGDTWLFHLARYDYSIHLPGGVELSSTAPLTVADFHKYEEWAPLVFEGS